MDTDPAAFIQLPRHEEDTRKNYIYRSKQKIVESAITHAKPICLDLFKIKQQLAASSANC